MPSNMAANTKSYYFVEKSKCHKISPLTGLEIATDTIANATNIFSLATKNSGLVATLVTRYFSMS